MSKGKMRLEKQALIEKLECNGAKVVSTKLERSIDISMPGIGLLGTIDGLVNHYGYWRTRD